MIRNGVAWGMLLPAICMLTLGVPATAQNHTIITFDAPGAGTTIGYGTEVIAMNPAGAFAGFYVGYDNVVHAYEWTPEEGFTSFDGPGVPTGVPADPFSPGSTWMNTSAPGTYALAIDARGAVTGYYIDASNVAHGYLRGRDGQFTSFNVSGAGTGAGQGTFAANMNLEGTIAGQYLDTNNMSHGFVRALDGAITGFDVPAAANGPWLGTWLSWGQCLTTTGAITGNYYDSNGVSHGFVRYPNGKITTFQFAATGLTAGQGTYPWAINPAGATAGSFEDANNVYHGLVRAANGRITVFDVPGADGNTVVEAIDPAGTVAGFYNDANYAHHGFLRSANGWFDYFDVPGAGSQAYQGTVPAFINPEGVVTGFWIDDNWVWHGLVRK